MFKNFKLRCLLILSFIIGFGSTYLSADIWNMPPTPFSILDSNSSDLAYNPQGNAIAIWANRDQLTVEVSYFSNNAWGASQILDSSFTSNYTKVAMDQTGTGLAIWCVLILQEIRTAYFNGTAWVTPPPAPLDTLSAFTDNASTSIAMDGNGNGIAVWIDPGLSIVRSSSFTAGAWSAPVTIGTGTNTTSVAFSSNGTAVAMWSDSVNTWVNNYISGVWGVSQTIGTSAPPYRMEIGIDSNGNAIASFLDALNNVSISYYNGSIWAPSQIISTAPGNVDLSFAMAGNGTAVLAWVDSSNIGLSSTFNGSTWSVPFSFAPNVLFPHAGFPFPSSSISVVLDTIGNALITWGSTSGEVRSERLSLGSNVWTDNSFIAANIPEGIIDINAGLADNGRGFAVWQNLFNIEASQVFGSFTLFVGPTPPVSIQGRVCNNKFASQTDRVHIITWASSIDPLTVSYNIRRNGVLIATVPLVGPFIYLDHNRCKKHADTYAVTAVGANGLESTPLIVILR